MKFEVYNEEKEEERIVYIDIEMSYYGPALIVVDENGRYRSTIASINSLGQLILHQNISPKTGLDLTLIGQIKLHKDTDK